MWHWNKKGEGVCGTGRKKVKGYVALEEKKRIISTEFCIRRAAIDEILIMFGRLRLR
jgi:hypothetical protein